MDRAKVDKTSSRLWLARSLFIYLSLLGIIAGPSSPLIQMERPGKFRNRHIKLKKPLSTEGVKFI